MAQIDDSNDIAYSYVPVPRGPHAGESPAESRGKLKAGVAIVCGLLLLASLVAYNGYNESNNKRDELYSTLKSHSNEDKNKTVTFQKWMPVSRGVSAGVSEKSNGMFQTNTNLQTYPWNDNVLSWQRTAFHFQPKHNWMNGRNSFLLVILCLYLVECDETNFSFPFSLGNLYCSRCLTGFLYFRS